MDEQSDMMVDCMVAFTIGESIMHVLMWGKGKIKKVESLGDLRCLCVSEARAY